MAKFLGVVLALPEERPDMRTVIRKPINNQPGSWELLYTRTYRHIFSIEIRNMDLNNTLYYSHDENPAGGNYDEVEPNGSVTEYINPKEMYANTSAGRINVIIIVKYYSTQYYKELVAGNGIQ